MHFENIFTWLRTNSNGILQSLLATAIGATITLNYKIIVGLYLRVTSQQDTFLLGDWHVYRYSRRSGSLLLLADKWTIKRTIFNKFALTTSSTQYPEYKLKGAAVFMERRRLDLDIIGTTHRQHSFVSFRVGIPAQRADLKMLGIGIGEDFDQILCSRIYLASAIPMDEKEAMAVLDDASRRFAETDRLHDLPALHTLS
jgi:hypothetical protein